MSQGPPLRPARKSSEEPRQRFSWPPTEDELSQYGSENVPPDTTFEEAVRDAGESPAVEALPAPVTIGMYASETDAVRLPAFPQEASPSPADSDLALVVEPPAALFPLPETEPFPADASPPPASWTPVDKAETPSDVEDFEYAWSEATSVSGIVVSPGAIAVDPPEARDFAGEIAHLQALIEGLTQKIEWRVFNSGRR